MRFVGPKTTNPMDFGLGFEPKSISKASPGLPRQVHESLRSSGILFGDTLYRNSVREGARCATAP